MPLTDMPRRWPYRITLILCHQENLALQAQALLTSHCKWKFNYPHTSSLPKESTILQNEKFIFLDFKWAWSHIINLFTKPLLKQDYNEQLFGLPIFLFSWYRPAEMKASPLMLFSVTNTTLHSSFSARNPFSTSPCSQISQHLLS